MENSILGLHHITAIANNARRNYEFYSKVMGLRLVKKTVNFDDPGTYHFYFGDETGSPGTILTFFPWEGIGAGYNGTGMITGIGYSVPEGSLDFWVNRFSNFNIKQDAVVEVFGEQHLPFQDPDGLKINLVVPAKPDLRTPWQTEEVTGAVATRGFHHITLLLKNATPTASVLTDIFGYKLLKQEGNRYRFITDTVENASIVDIVEAPNVEAGRSAAGTNHHVAFRVKNEEVLMQFREKVIARGLNITPKIDRDYFFSLYFREPGGVLFELATDNPGFTKDEPASELGSALKLPKQYEASRKEIEAHLPALS
ncbi:MAG: ring-cleaving dioxygenase [Chitinophagaceae bacterium]|nr:ring-cleaving dioxygenase [Chitinophagaceae bacterium]